MKINILLLLYFLFNASLNAQTCENFENQDTANWTGVNSTITVMADGTNSVLDANDNAGSSWVINTGYNNTNVGCGYSYRYRILDDAIFQGSDPITIQIFLFTNQNMPNTGLHARFILNTSINENSGWQNISVPINTIANGAALPSNALGQWQMSDPTQWNTLIQSFTGVAFSVDVANSIATSENIQIDDFCNFNDLDTDFTIDPGCLNGNYYIDLFSSDDPNATYTWSLYQTTQPNETTGGQLIAFLNSTPVVSIGDLDVTNYYYVVLTVQSNLCSGSDTSVQVVPFYEITSDFVLLDEDGNITKEFCYSEDIILDGSNSVGEDNYKFYIKRRPLPNPNNQDWSQYDEYGWINDEAGVSNLSNIFVSQGYYFLAGYEYAITLAVQNTSECVNWIISEQFFTIKCCDGVVPDLNADFDFITDCVREYQYYIGAVVFDDEQPNVSFNWTIFQTDIPDVTTGGIAIHSGSGTEFEYDGMEIENFYYIQVTAIDKICENSVSYAQVIPYYAIGSEFHFEDDAGIQTTNFCYGQDVILNGLASYGEDNYYVGLQRRPFPDNGESYSYVGTLGWSGQQAGVFNLSSVFADIGIYFEPGYEYRVGLAVQNTDECVNWVLTMKSFVVQCCGDIFSAKFDLDPTPITDTDLYSLTALEITEFSNISVEHEWTLISTPDVNEGPYTEVSNTTGDSFYAEVEQGLCYIVIHTLITSCGEFCYAQNVCINLNKSKDGPAQNSKFVGVIDCDILDTLFCNPPINLSVDCSNYPVNEVILNWDDVALASEYTVQLSFNNPKCCSSKYKPQNIEIVVDTNFLDLLSQPIPFPWDCFSWKVKSNCADQDSKWSKNPCFSACSESRSIVELQDLEVDVFPNPTQNDVRLSFGSEFTGVIQLINLEGRILAIQKYTNVQNVDFSLLDQAPGAYILLVIDKNGSFPYRIVKF